jgi:hypothetical protein
MIEKDVVPIERTEDLLAIQKKDDYLSKVINARSRFLRERLDTNKRINDLYVKLIKKINRYLKAKKFIGKKELLRKKGLKETKEQIGKRLKEEFKDDYEKLLEESMKASSDAGSESSMVYLDKAGFNTVGARTTINQKAVESLWNQIGEDGLQVSDRVWNLIDDNQKVITDIVVENVALGRDAVETAKELEKYARGGVQAISDELAERKRFPKNLDYRALRLARTENSKAFMEGTYRAGKFSPTYSGIKWVLSNAHPEPDVCDPMVGKYEQGREPAIPHPNCMCVQVPYHNETIDEFTERTNRWRSDPASEPKLEQWYQNAYKPTIR